MTLSFRRDPSGPSGLILRGWTVLDAQTNRTTVNLSNQRFNVPVSDNNFRYPAPRPHTPPTRGRHFHLLPPVFTQACIKSHQWPSGTNPRTDNRRVGKEGGKR